jgi:hypothetical protein
VDSISLVALPITYTRYSSSPFVLHARPSHPLRLDILIMLGEEYKSRSFSLCSFLHAPVTSSLFSPLILLSTTFSNTLSPSSFFNVRDQVSHQYKTTGKIRVSYILIFILLVTDEKTKVSGLSGSKYFQNSVSS